MTLCEQILYILTALLVVLCSDSKIVIVKVSLQFDKYMDNSTCKVGSYKVHSLYNVHPSATPNLFKVAFEHLSILFT